uniref:Fatty acid-binding protein, liver-type n=1 Tax=Gasterosteus aculeatus aculeatus TaxID=481459 RepID=A0AAQ4RIX3_GASAC
MAFAGKWETESQEGYDAFCKLLGIPNDVIEKGRDYKLITEVTQDGDNFSWCQIYPTNARVTNNFTIGKECDMETIGGKKFKATVHMEGGKLTTAFPNYQHTTEISGGKLIEVKTPALFHSTPRRDHPSLTLYFCSRGISVCK